MWENFIDQRVSNLEYLGRSATHWLDQHFVNILIILLGAYVFRKFGTKIISTMMNKTIRHDLFPSESDRKKRVETLDNLIGAILRLAAWVIAGFMIISELGINTAPLLASAGVFGLALGFGAQSLVKDFVTGIFIITENQYRIGDWIEVNNVKGVVEAITIRTTVIRSLSGELSHIPNGSITVTTNKSMDFGSINEDITVAMNSDIAKVEHVINHVGEQVAADHEFKDMIKEPPQFVQVKGFDTSGIVIKVLGKTTSGNAWKVKSEFYKRLIKAFDQHNIEVPYKQITVHQAKRNS